MTDRWWFNSTIVAGIGAVSLLLANDAFAWGWMIAALFVFLLDAFDRWQLSQIEKEEESHGV